VLHPPTSHSDSISHHSNHPTNQSHNHPTIMTTTTTSRPLHSFGDGAAAMTLPQLPNGTASRTAATMEATWQEAHHPCPSYHPKTSLHPSVTAVPIHITDHPPPPPTPQATLLVTPTEATYNMNHNNIHFDPMNIGISNEYPPPQQQLQRQHCHHSSVQGGIGTTMTTTPPTLASSSATPPEYVYSMIDQSIICDQYHRPITVGRLLATKPLVTDVMTRPGPGNKKLVYLSGDTITRSLNEIFTYTGWNLQIVKTEQVLCVDTKATSAAAAAANVMKKPPTTNTTATPSVPQPHPPMWHVAYLSHVRITLTQSGTYREDLGAGDAMDKNLGTAIQHAIKASITDAMKRAARHFGDKLGNSLYQGTFRIANAPKTLYDALDQYDQQHASKYKNINTTTTTAKSVTTSPTATASVAPTGPPVPMMPRPNHKVVLPITNTVVQQHHHHPPTTTAVTNAPPSAPNHYSSSSCTNAGSGSRNSTVLPQTAVNAVAATTNVPSFVTKPNDIPSTTTATIFNATKPPLTASENLQHLQSRTSSGNHNDAAMHRPQHYNNNERSVATATVVTSVNTHNPTAISAATTTAVTRPRTSSGRIRKSLSPTIGTSHPSDNAKENAVVVTKKTKLNPYST
jgi:Rad52/22 family double-strand break repair protein